jgi:FtsP/CotA-like multicopper oxidase with cupredoxin domain
MRALPLAALAVTSLLLSGCFGSGGGFDFEPGTKYKETGRTVHLRATVVDLAGQEVAPGLKANLWAFCFQPVDPNDSYSANAIEKFTPLEGDVTPAGFQPGECSVPGPTLRVKQGDRVKVEFSHSHFHPHTIHWHGQFVPWESDGAPGVTQDSIPSGGSITYDFIAKRAGTLWYHCHVDTQTHIMQGLYGVMIIEPQDTKYEPKDITKEYVFVFSTMNRNGVEAPPNTSLHGHPPGCASGFQGCENPRSPAGEPDVFLLNGHSYPLTMDQPETMPIVKEGDRLRFRILNAGETFETLHPHGHDMLVTHRDGNPLPAPFWVDTLTIGPAERYDVVLEMNNPGPWMMHTHVASRETNCAKAPGGMHTMFLYEGFEPHAFKAELPADCPFGSELQLPGDFTNATMARFGTVIGQAAADRTWDFPVELPCAVRRLNFHASLDSTALPGGVPQPGALTTVTLVLKDPVGNDVLRQDLTDLVPAVSYVLEKERLTELSPVIGSYTATLSTGQSMQASVDLFVNLDYYETFEQSKTAHLVYKIGGCPGYT